MKKPFVICISAISGGGKTAVTKELIKLLNNSAVITFDNYLGDLLKQNYCQWSADGADYNEWHLEPIVNDIQRLLQDNYENIILDYPFGYGNKAVGEFIDYVFFIDTPLDIALSRRIIRDYTRRDISRRRIENLIEHLDSTLSFYLKEHRETYLQHIDTVKPFSNYVIDGCLPVKIIANMIFERTTIIKNQIPF